MAKAKAKPEDAAEATTASAGTPTSGDTTAAAAPILGEGDGSSAGAGIAGETAADAPRADDAAQTDAGKPDTSPPQVEAALEVIGPKTGRWRAGRHFTDAPVLLPLASLSDAEIAALKGDPSLTVREIV